MLRISLACISILISIGIMAQENYISGYVFNKNGEPIQNVSVKAIHSKTFAKTNVEGFYSILLKADSDTIQVSHIGFLTAFTPIDANSKNLKTYLVRSENQIEEVVINTGYQQLNRQQATGAYEHLSAEDLSLQTGTNILDRIKGMSSGVSFEPNKTGAINPIKIRGNSTLNGPQDVLIILDDFPYTGDVNNINPDDIESVTILKDASATAIWGARAGNGVVVLTSKKGKVNQPIKIDFKANVLVEEKPKPFLEPRISSSDYIDVEQMLYRNGFYDFDIMLNPYSKAAFSPALEVFIQRREGLISKEDSTTTINRLKEIDISQVFLDKIYRKPITQQYGLSISGGGRNNAFNAGINLDKTIGHLSDKNDRLNIKLNNMITISKKLSLDLGAYFTDNNSSSGKSDFTSLRIASRSIPYIPLFDTEGNALPVSHKYRPGFIDTVGSGKMLDWQYFPLSDWERSPVKVNRRDLIANIGLRYKITDNLGMSIKYKKQSQTTGTDRHYMEESYYVRDLVNLYSQRQKDGSIISVIPEGGIQNWQKSAQNSYNVRIATDFTHQWNRNDLTLFGGWDIQEVENKTESGSHYGYRLDPINSTVVDLTKNYPQITGGQGFLPYQNGLSRNVNRYVSVFGTASYGFNERYYISGSLRRDAANIFGLSTNDKWKPLWSIGAAWNLHKEKFIQNWNIQHAKFRVTYGKSGNVNSAKSARPIVRFYVPRPALNYYRAGRVLTLNNPSLRWEEVSTLNFGLDLTVFSGLVDITADYYHKRGDDLYGLAAYDYTGWGLMGTVERNVASIKGNGIDLSIKLRKQWGQLGWHPGVLVNMYRDEVLEYYHAEGVVYRPTSGETVSAVVGKPVYAIQSYRWAGLDNQGNPQGYLNGEKSIDYNKLINSQPMHVDSLAYSGAAMPVWYGNFLNGLYWKGLSLDFNIAFRLGYYFRRGALSYNSLFTQGNGHGEFADRWQKEGDENVTNVPAMVYPNNQMRDSYYISSEATVERADNIRLQFVNLAYNLDDKYAARIGVRTLTLSLNASNIAVLWKKTKLPIDPDGVRSQRVYTVGLKAGF